MISVILLSYMQSVWILASGTASLHVEQCVGKEHLTFPDGTQIYVLFTSNWLIGDNELQLNKVIFNYLDKAPLKMIDL